MDFKNDIRDPQLKKIVDDTKDRNVTAEDLMDTPMEELRRMAVQDLHIVGARSIQGGKAVLVARILEVIMHGKN